MSLDPDSFRVALGHFASGVTIVTARIGSTDHGMTVSSFCSLSLEPPLVLACIDRTAEMHDLLVPGGRMVVNILAEEQEVLSRRFAEEPGALRFEGVGFTRDEDGIAQLDGVTAWLACRVTQRHDGGDHTMVVAEVERATTLDRRPLVYYRGRYGGLGI